MTKAFSRAAPGRPAPCVSTVDCFAKFAGFMRCSPMPYDPTRNGGTRKHAARLTPGPMSPLAARLSALRQPRYPYHASGPVALRPCLATGLPLINAFECDTFRRQVKVECPYSQAVTRFGLRHHNLSNMAAPRHPAARRSNAVEPRCCARRSVISATLCGRASTNPCAASQPRWRR